MALVSLSFAFFRALEIALDAVKNGEACLSVFLLKATNQGGSLLRQHTTLLCDKLNETEKEHQQIESRNPYQRYERILQARGGFKKEKGRTRNNEILDEQRKGFEQSKKGGCMEEISRGAERDERS